MRFGAIEALKGVDLDIYPGQVLGLLGDNGAGKSTLIKVVAGVHTPSAGHITFEGRETRMAPPEHARALGVETIYQDLAMAGNLDIATNIFLGREQRKRFLGVFPGLDRAKMRREAEKPLEQLGIHIPNLRAEVGTLSGGQQQSVAIARALYWEAKLVIMDEPTAALGVSEHDAVLQLISKLAGQGVAVILITHVMADAMKVTDRIAVLTRGAKALEDDTSALSEDDVVRAMLVGREGRAA